MNINGQDLSEFTSHLVVMRQMGLHEIADAIFTAHQQELDERERKAILKGASAIVALAEAELTYYGLTGSEEDPPMIALSRLKEYLDDYKRARGE